MITPRVAADHRVRPAVDSRSGDSRLDTPRAGQSSFLGAVPLALVVLALLGSLAIPARQTWLITKLLRESTEVLAPGRLLLEQLQTGIAKEQAALQSYALSGDGARLAHYRATADDDDRRLVVLERLFTRFNTTFAGHAHTLRGQIGEWRRLNDSLIVRSGSRAQFIAALRVEEARYDSSTRAIASLSSELAAEASARDDRVRSLEHLSIVSNAALVLAALVAVSGVGVLTVRERRLTVTLRLRVSEESALREAAESLAGAYTVDEVTERIAQARGPFRSDDVGGARIFDHLAALAYEKVRLLEEAHERRRALERVMHSRSRLMRGFSHDVKNPIGAADGFAELLSLGIYGELSTKQRASIDRIRRNIHSALALIDDLHELARAETGNLALASKPVNLAALVRALCEEYHAAAQARGLSLSMELEGDGPIVETDQARVRQIAANLLSNAIKYTEHGWVTVRARQQAEGPSNGGRDWAVLEVADSGAGVPANKQDYIFEEFSRLGVGASSGAGLGLAISKLLAEGLGGQISVASELGRGSTFTLWLPSSRV